MLHIKKNLKLFLKQQIISRTYNFNILSQNETIDLILKNNLSVSRFGDGEFNLLANKSINFQEKNKIISERLRKILYENNNINNLVCIPGILNYRQHHPLMARDARDFWINYLYNNNLIKGSSINQKQ